MPRTEVNIAPTPVLRQASNARRMSILLGGNQIKDQQQTKGQGEENAGEDLLWMEILIHFGHLMMDPDNGCGLILKNGATWRISGGNIWMERKKTIILR